MSDSFFENAVKFILLATSIGVTLFVFTLVAFLIKGLFL